MPTGRSAIPYRVTPSSPRVEQVPRIFGFWRERSIYPHRVGETYNVRYNPDHRWYYVPQLRTDEALLIKCYDSKTDGRARFVAHTAFDDPTTPPDAPPRESV